MPPSVKTGTRSGRSIDVRIVVEDAASEELRQARRQFNSAIKQVMIKVGERTVLPDMRSQLPGRWGDRLYVQRERSGVFVGSRHRGAMNRAFGWYDFGGKRPLDSGRRTGPKVLVKTLDKHRDRIDDLVLEGLMDEFSPLEHRP